VGGAGALLPCDHALLPAAARSQADAVSPVPALAHGGTDALAEGAGRPEGAVWRGPLNPRRASALPTTPRMAAAYVATTTTSPR
jgi:hypothetical protein